MWDNFGDDCGFKFGQSTYDGLEINPTDQYNPLKAFHMGPTMNQRREGVERHKEKTIFNKHKYRLSLRRKRFFSTSVMRPLETVTAVRKYFNDINVWVNYLIRRLL